MPHVSFTHHLRHLVPPHALAVPGSTVRETLVAVFAQYPALRSYILTDQGQLRRHIALFIDNELHRDGLDAPVADDTEIHIMQALSGG